MDYQCIKYEVQDRILTITLNRPDKLNAFTDGMYYEVLDALEKGDKDDEVRVVIFTGAGKGYCAGSDLSADGGKTFDFDKAPEEWRDRGGRVALRIYEMKKPVIGAINGAAVGVGATMTLPMDIRIASKSAKFGFVFARRGIMTEACSGYFLPRVVGIAQAMEWAATGRVFSAEEALAGGLVSRVVEPEELIPAAQTLAREIADNTAPVSIAIIRQLMWRMLGAAHPMDSHEVESMGMQWLGKQPDAKEGIASFMEKRPPHFTMSPENGMPPFYPWWPARTFRNR